MKSTRRSPLKYRGRVQHVDYQPRRRGLKITIISILVGVLTFVATGVGLAYWDLSSQIKDVKGLNKLVGRTTNHNSWTGRGLNILVIGSDSRLGDANASLDGMSAQEAAQIDPTQRSDTTMLVHITPDHEHAYVVSIPRDTMVNMPRCERANGTSVGPLRRTQFNTAFMFGGGDNGDLASAVACTWKTVEDLSGLKIDESVVVDFSGFAKMIDALGGISVYVDKNINDVEYSGLKLKAGCHLLDGAQALEYARVRHGVMGGDGSDLQRIQRQQRVVGIMIHEAISKNVLTSPGALYGFAKGALGALSVSDGLNSVSSLSSLALSLQDLRPANLIFLSLPVEPDKIDSNRVMLQQPLADEVWEALKNDSPMPRGLQARNGAGYQFETGSERQQTAGADEASASERVVQYPGFVLPLDEANGAAGANGSGGANGTNGTNSAGQAGNGRANGGAGANGGGEANHGSSAQGPSAGTKPQPKNAEIDNDKLAELQAQCEAEHN